jgi:hypothetical protein
MKEVIFGGEEWSYAMFGRLESSIYDAFIITVICYIALSDVVGETDSVYNI